MFAISQAAFGGAASPVQRRPRLHGSIRLARDLAVRIMRGDFPSGHVFPGEIEFSETLRISRTALREAFRIIAAKGLVESRPHAGTRVNERRRWSLLDPELLAWQFESEPTLPFVRDLFELRMMVEPHAAALAARRRDQAQVVRMEEALGAMRRHGLSVDAGRMADQTFHTVLLEATGNEAVLALAPSILAAIAWTTKFKQRSARGHRDPLPEHLALFEAVAAGRDDAAELAMRDLIALALADTEIALRKD